MLYYAQHHHITMPCHYIALPNSRLMFNETASSQDSLQSLAAKL